MQLSQVAAPIAAMLSTVKAWEETGTYWASVITTPYTTYCPSATTFALSGVTYTATEEETVTITNCPCTISVSQPPLITSTIDDCTDDPSYTGTGEARPLPTGNGPDSDSIFGGKPSTITIYTPSPTTWIFGTVPVTTVRPTSLSAGSAGNDPTITFSGSSGNAPTAMISGSIGSTKTPVGPVTSRPASVTVAAAAKAGPAGAILAAGLALFAL